LTPRTPKPKEAFLYCYLADVLEVIDGDTCKLRISLGCNVSIEEVVRLYGINAPELHAPDPAPGLAAKKALADLIEGKRLVVKTHKDESEKYGRLLAEIFPLDQQDKSVNQVLLESGHAVSYFGGPR